MRKEGMWRSSVPLELAGGGRFVIPHDEFVPAYVKTYEEGRLREKAEEALELLRSCHVCPRDCKVNRLENKTRRMQKRTACARDERIYTLRRRGLSAGLEWLRDYLFCVVQSAVCLLPEL
jgi:hypothetical protein